MQTLKDLIRNMRSEGFDTKVVFPEELKEEVIRWIKELKLLETNPKTYPKWVFMKKILHHHITNTKQLRLWIINFFNITEEDIKNQTITCKECEVKCCIGWLYDRITGENKAVLPPDQINISYEGIPLIRKSRFIWVCKDFDEKKGLCTNYDNRPDICKAFYCEAHIEGRRTHTNFSIPSEERRYGLCFSNKRTEVQNGKKKLD